MTPLQNIVLYTDDAAGLEKCLRLLQGFCNIAIGLTNPITHNAELRRYTSARNQFALGRRYFRLLKWYPCFTRTSALLSSAQSSERGGVAWVFELLKFTFLGLYFFLEALTITNAVGLTEWSWGPGVVRESNKCWFYALVASICLGGCQLWAADGVGEVEGKGKGKKGKGKGIGKKIDRRLVYTQIVIDTADLFIPGAAVGWIEVSMLVVGTASTISTVLAGQQIWRRIVAAQQSQAERIEVSKKQD